MGLRPAERGESGIVDKGLALLDREICTAAAGFCHLFAGWRLLGDRSTFQGTSEGALERKRNVTLRSRQRAAQSRFWRSIASLVEAN